MFKRTVCFALAFSAVLCGTAQADMGGAEETGGSLYEKYTSAAPDKDNGYEYMPLEEFTEKALRNDTESKKVASNLDLLEKQKSYYGENYSASSSYSSLSSLLSSQSSYKSARNTKISAEEAVKYSAKEVYAGIITDERALVVSEAALKLEESKLNISKAKNRLGLISDDELKQQQQQYEQSKRDYENQKNSLELSYQSLNLLIGEAEDKKYKFELPLTYEELDLEISVDTYVKAKAPEALSVRNAEIALENAENMFRIRGLNESTSTEVYNYDSMKNDVNEASLAVKEQQDSVEESLRALYNTIKEQESSIEFNIAELERLEGLYETAQSKYNTGAASQIEVEEAKLDVIEKEYAVLQEMYSHMLNVEKFKNIDLF